MKSDKPNVNPVNRTRQPGKRDDAFAVRFSAALKGRDRAWLARETNLAASTLHDYARGAIPSADRAFLIADALGVDARWLVTGAGGAGDGEQPEWVLLPHRGLAPGASPQAGARVRRDWLHDTFGRSEDLWITRMPTNAFPQIAGEGDFVICADADGLVEGGVYLVQLDFGVTVRRLAATPQGSVLTADSVAEQAPTPFSHGPAGPPLLGRVLGTLLKAV